MKSSRLAWALPAALVAALALAGSAAAGNGHGRGPFGDVVDVGNDAAKAGKLKLDRKTKPAAGQVAATTTTVRAAASETTPLGTRRFWPLINFNTGFGEFQQFTLVAVGDKIEVWVADNLSFPTGDCRNDGQRNVVTQAQIDYLVHEFDDNMFPKMSEAFSVAPDRNGAGATLPSQVGLPQNYWDGAGDKIVTLVANFKDQNFLDINFPSYTAGYHSSGINAWVDRNVMSIDSYDWLHRTGANPPNEPSTVLCLNRPAQPFRYEAIFAHEYQHLLEFWASPGERTWVNEGLSDYAMTLTGYAFPARSIHETGWDSHVQTFLGWRSLQTPANLIPQPNGGAENSLTVWDDQGPLESLADYGAVYTFMEFLSGRYGLAFMRDLHTEDLNGLPGLQAVLDRYLAGTTAMQVVREWAAMVALDAAIDAGGKLRGQPHATARYQAPTLNSSIHWANPQSYSTPGAPPNGSDYVQLRDAAGAPLTAAALRSLDFEGAARHDLLPVEWQSVVLGGEAVLSAGADHNLDRRILREIAVPASGDRTLTFRMRAGIESLWDYGVVQVSADGGATWTSLANANTTTAHDPDARPSIVAELPGFTGDVEWRTETFDLAAYAGRTVLLAFRMLTDGATLGNEGGIEAGWWIDDVRVGGQLLSDGSSLAGWRAEVEAPAVAGFTVQLVGLSSSGASQPILAQVPLAGGRTASLSGGALRRLIGDEVELVGAIVTYEEPTESITRYAPYRLRANGVVQPGS